MTLVGVFVGEIFFGCLYLLVSCDPTAEKVQALKELATIFLSPTVALVGAATGFYFGGKAPS
jgi:hypothetical protein